MAEQADRDGQAAPRVLLIDADHAASREALGGFSASFVQDPVIISVKGGRAAAEILRGQDVDIVLMDLASLEDLSETTEDAVARLVRLTEGALLIALSDGTSVSSAVAAMRAGAHDFIPKPLNATDLAHRMAELARRHGKARALIAGPRPLRGLPRYSGFIGASSQMQFVYEQIERIAPSAAPVFITGESGTGKEVCARALHASGPRSGAPFIAISCAAIPRESMESVLFGVRRGAYTGAIDDRRGAIEDADGGTLFLDEIGALDMSLQSRLLRFLQTGRFARVGETVARNVDVRVVCATSRNPMQMIADRSFREDLFYRLHVLPIHLPPLRQRPTDIMVLANHFLERFAQEEHKKFAGFSEAAALALVGRDWPGNVRQLQALVHRLAVMFDGGEVTESMLSMADVDAGTGGPPATGTAKEPAILPMWRQEQRIIEEAIASFSGNIALAAAALELSPSTIYRKRQAWAEMAGDRKGAA